MSWPGNYRNKDSVAVLAERRSCEARRANFFEGNFSDSLQGWFFPGIVLQGWLFRDGLAPLIFDILLWEGKETVSLFLYQFIQCNIIIYYT